MVYFGTTEVDLSAKKATRRGETGPENVRLTPTEWQFLELLIKNKGNLVTRQMILTEIWGSEHVTDTGYLYISQLRRKLEPDPQNPKFLLTESGMGYRFNEGA